MAILGGRSREELITECAEARAEAKVLREQVAYLQDALRRTQDALIAKEAPIAYEEQIIEREKARELTPEELAAREYNKKQRALDMQLLEEIEAPLFKSAEDMQEMLSRPLLARSLETEPLHEGDES